MPQRYEQAILKYLSDRDDGLKPRQLARQIGISEDEYGTFREAVKQLHDAGRIVMGSKNALTLPEMTKRVVGHFRPHVRGFGFVIPETPNAHGDLFIPAGGTSGAMNGDLVAARVYPQGKKGGKRMYAGQIVEILQRAQNRFVGTLSQSEGAWFVVPDGKHFTRPIVIRDVSAAGPKSGSKVVVEILDYGNTEKLPAGVIVEELGLEGRTHVETLAVIRAYGLRDEFPEEVLAEARERAQAFDPQQAHTDDRREDLTGEVIATIDPPDARDYDDAIGIGRDKKGRRVLGVHIADVSAFVEPGGAIDVEARQRSTSVYFPRRVIPMLPEVLSNAVCSLQEGENRLAMSVFITYDENAQVVSARFAETVIRSRKRLTYLQAQQILEGKTGGYPGEIVKLVREMESLARDIEARRREAGMLHLDLPEVELVLDENDKVVDAVPEDQSYTHTIIEMFMVEANEAVARRLTDAGCGYLRRIHPPPDLDGRQQLTKFVKAAGHKLPRDLDRKDLQQILASVKDRPESYAVNLAILKMFQQAEYSPMHIEHFALASRHYCHFTSPIRRYPDLTVHRLVRMSCRGELEQMPPQDPGELAELGEHCSTADRRADHAANELRDVLVLEYLSTKVGESFEGVITGVANFGIFVQSQRFLVEGLVRMQDLGDDWWDVRAPYGEIVGEQSGRRYRIGDMLRVRIASVDVNRRQLNLVPEGGKSKSDGSKKKSEGSKKKSSSGGRRGKRGGGRKKTGSGGNKAASGGNKAGSGGKKTGSGGNKAASGGNKAGSGGNKAPSGGNKAGSGGKKTASGAKSKPSGESKSKDSSRAAFFNGKGKDGSKQGKGGGSGKNKARSSRKKR